MLHFARFRANEIDIEVGRHELEEITEVVRDRLNDRSIMQFRLKA
jgi:hypothetical protein